MSGLRSFAFDSGPGTGPAKPSGLGMVSWLNSAPLAPPMRFRLAAVALSCLEHEKNTFFS